MHYLERYSLSFSFYFFFGYLFGDGQDSPRLHRRAILKDAFAMDSYVCTLDLGGNWVRLTVSCATRTSFSRREASCTHTSHRLEMSMATSARMMVEMGRSKNGTTSTVLVAIQAIVRVVNLVRAD